MPADAVATGIFRHADFCDVLHIGLRQFGGSSAPWFKKSRDRRSRAEFPRFIAIDLATMDRAMLCYHAVHRHAGER
jgi:hypothetical protein